MQTVGIRSRRLPTLSIRQAIRSCSCSASRYRNTRATDDDALQPPWAGPANLAVSVALVAGLSVENQHGVFDTLTVGADLTAAGVLAHGSHDHAREAVLLVVPNSAKHARPSRRRTAGRGCILRIEDVRCRRSDCAERADGSLRAEVALCIAHGQAFVGSGDELRQQLLFRERLARLHVGHVVSTVLLEVDCPVGERRRRSARDDAVRRDRLAERMRADQQNADEC